MEDHPRVCGEKIIAQNGLLTLIGSPPRVRGKDMTTAARCICYGITPACAGKSPTTVCARVLCEDHPRVCGEKTKESLKK